MTIGASGPTGWSAGIDIGGTKVSAVLLAPDTRVRDALWGPTRRGAEGITQSALDVVERLCQRHGLQAASLQSVGVGVPGLVDPDGGSVIHAVNLDIDGTPAPLAKMLSVRLGGPPVHVENDVNVAAVGAAHVLDVVDEDLAYLALGTGVAAGIVLDGRLRRGHHGVAGEIGHVPYDRNGPRCPCGQIGCLELYASGSALEAAWPSRRGRPAPAEVFEAAQDGDPVALRLRTEFADAVATCVRMLVLTVGVHYVVLGGGVSAIGEPLLDAVVGSLSRRAQESHFLRSLDLSHRVRLSPAGIPVAPVGAALLARTKSTAAAID
jgi:predicted NBD/HSP70 family sugar kinase